MPLHQFIHEQKIAYVMKVLRESNGCVTKAARIAGVCRTHIYKIMHTAGMKPSRMNHGNAAWRSLRKRGSK